MRAVARAQGGSWVKFGLALPNSGPLAGPANIRRVAEEAEALGFDALLVHDHISYDTEWLGHRTSGLTEPHAAISPDLYESLVTLSFAAAATRTIRLATAVLVLPLRDPRVLARQLITLQALCGGRLSLGVGSGDYPADYRVMEIPYNERAAYTREYVEALCAFLPGGRVDFEGKKIRVERGAFFPETAEIPLLMGGGIRPNPGTGNPGIFEPPLRVLARRCHGWMPEGPPEIIREGIETISRLADGAGRTSRRFEIRAQSPLYIGDDDEARRKLKRNLDYELVGSVERIVSLLERYRAAGVDAMNLRCFADDEASYYDMVRIFARDILPRFS